MLKSRSDGGGGHRDGLRLSICRETNRWTWWLSNRCGLRCRRIRWTLKRKKKEEWSKNGTLPSSREEKEKKEKSFVRSFLFIAFAFRRHFVPISIIFPSRPIFQFSRRHIWPSYSKVVLSNFPHFLIFPHFSSIHPLDLFRFFPLLIQSRFHFTLEEAKQQLLMNWIVGCSIGCRVEQEKKGTSRTISFGPPEEPFYCSYLCSRRIHT